MGSPMLGLRRFDVILRNTCLSLIVIPAAILIGTNWGIVGVSITRELTFPFVFPLNACRVCKVLGIRLIQVLLTMAKPGIDGIAMYIAVIMLKMALGTVVEPKINIALLITAGIISHTSTVWSIYRNGCREVRIQYIDLRKIF